MKLLDLEMSIVRQLREVIYATYLCCMCAILNELRERYKDSFSERGLSLSARTIEEAHQALSLMEHAGKRNSGLADEWRRPIDDPSEYGPTGWLAATYTFHAFHREQLSRPVDQV